MSNDTKACVACQHCSTKSLTFRPNETVKMCDAPVNLVTGKRDPKPALQVRHDPKQCGHNARWFKAAKMADADL